MTLANHDMSDEELVTNALVDQSYFTTIVERYEARLGRYIYRLGVRVSEDKEDVLQEIFVKVYRNLNDFDNSFSFSSWVYRIAHNETVSWYRKRNVRPEGHLISDSDELLGYVGSDEPGAEQLFDEQVNQKEIARALLELDIKYREPLVLRFFEHKEYDEISDILKVPIGTVGTLIHRGKKQLSDQLKDERIRI